jgi:cyclophilin family peptidyl-prolyl cis-trans isomerase
MLLKFVNKPIMKAKILRYNVLAIALFFFFVLYSKTQVSAQTGTKVEIKTTAGTIVIKLYDQTPLHKKNFLKLVNEKYYDGVLFHRVIKDFMIQTGDPNSKTATKGQMLGNGGPNYTINAEISQTLYHKKGALSAARTGDNVNPEKKSSGSQFYIVQGKKYTATELDQMELMFQAQYPKLKGFKFSQKQRTTYQTIGGTPFLDMNYTVFGEVVKGIEIVDKIAMVKTDKNDRPIDDIKIISMKLVK